MSQVLYTSKLTSELTDFELEQCSRLFSKDYGVYGTDDPKNRSGQNVKMSPNYYRKYYNGENHRVALAINNGSIIAQAFYIRENINGEIIIWVLQLVVGKEWRNVGIGSKLLHSIWGFSGDYAWGLATANPFTVRTLEIATLRRVKPSIICKHMDAIESMCKKVHFVEKVTIDENHSTVDTNFFVDHSSLDEALSKYEGEWALGELPSGHEWLAFTFRDQHMDDDFSEVLEDLIRFSESQLKDAYGRMEISSQPWASHTSDEIDYISSIGMDLTYANILDAGCGSGRHTIELAKRYPLSHILGIDFSEKNIERAMDSGVNIKNIEFIEGDLRNFNCSRKFDLILSLYDVIGSFPDDKDNIAILKNYSTMCKSGSILVISVMNMELTRALVLEKNVGDIAKDPKILFDLKPANIMHKCGDVFNPEHYAIDTQSGFVFRKEQFSEDGSLPAEYIIRDRRYSMDQICDMVRSCDFDILDSRFVRAGRWDNALGSTDRGAKEILIVAKKR